jgi:predicted flavoprotein YhiN
LLTNYGLEGKPIYAVNRALRAMEKPTLTIDLKPQMTLEKIQQILKKAKNPTQGLKELKLSEVSLVWLRKFVSKENYNSAEQLAKQIKAFKIGIQSFRPIDEVISSAGGVATTELTPSGQLVKMDTIYCCGEMVDWDAPTGGYLIQACVSSGYVAGQAIRSLLIDAG